MYTWHWQCRGLSSYSTHMKRRRYTVAENQLCWKWQQLKAAVLYFLLFITTALSKVINLLTPSMWRWRLSLIYFPKINERLLKLWKFLYAFGFVKIREIRYTSRLLTCGFARCYTLAYTWRLRDSSPAPWRCLSSRKLNDGSASTNIEKTRL